MQQPFTGSPPPMQRPAAVRISVPVTLRWPNGCANCNAPPTRTSSTSHKSGRVQRTYAVPVCATCAQRESRHDLLGTVMFFVVLAASAGIASLQFPLRERAAIVLPGGLVLGLLFGFAVFAFLKPKKPVAPFTSSTQAVRLTGWNANQSLFYCANVDWAAELVRLNGGQTMPVPGSTPRAWATFATMAGLTFVLTIVAWSIARPSVMLVNATTKPLVLYVDGKKQTTLDPDKNELAEITYGHHVFGWSAPSESKPTTTIDAVVKVSHAHLVNPDEAGCYWLDGATYGSATIDDKSLGPLPLETFYTFDKVDLWFTSLPKSISTKQAGETRIALQHYPLCTDALKTCPKERVRAALACDRAAKTTDEGTKCWDACDDAPKETPKPAVEAVHAGPPVDSGVPDAGAGAGAKKKKKK